jgi:uncharacterized protein (TIGR03086 family)
VSERYARLAGDFLARVSRVSLDAWEAPSPCEGWSTRDVVRHVVELAAAAAEQAAGASRASVPSVEVDPVEAWRVASGNLIAVLNEPNKASRVVEGPMGPRPVAMLAAGLCNDLLVHTWDLSRAAGLDEVLDPEEVHLSFEQLRPMEAAMRASGVFGDRVEVPADADEQARFIAFMGRQP